jgi:hypothetical protein
VAIATTRRKESADGFRDFSVIDFSHSTHFGELRDTEAIRLETELIGMAMSLCCGGQVVVVGYEASSQYVVW